MAQTDSHQPMSERVRQLIVATLQHTGGSRASVASLLGLHPRTLQRRLAAEGTLFEDIRDEVRKSAALHLLRDTEVSFSQMAYLLGLSSPSAFTRSCRRWFGETPSRTRGTIHHFAGNVR